MYRKNLLICCALATLALALSGNRAEAQYPGQPLLGFNGHMQYGDGLMIDRVWWGSLAARIGLEPGDVIRRVNGWRIASWTGYLAALRAADGYVWLEVRDVRTGYLRQLRVRLDNGSGPPVYGSRR